MQKGRIITVVGAPRSGKSFLVRRLAERLGAEMILEGEEGEFPSRIEEDIRDNIRPLERVLWFRTMLIEKYLRAMKMRDEGKTVVLDVFWMSPHMFIDVLLEGFERELMWDVAKTDTAMLGWPDLTIYLKISEEGARKFLKLGGRTFDQSEEMFNEQILPVMKIHDEFFAGTHGDQVMTIDRDGLDFEREEDLAVIIGKMQSVLGSIDVR